MGVRARNIKNLLKDARSRTILVITFGLLIMAILIGYFLFRQVVQGPQSSAAIESAPDIQSIPTGAKASPEYIKLLNQDNLQRAQEAQKTGTSAIPTIISSVNPADAKIVQGASDQPWQTGLGFKELAESQKQGTPKAFDIDALRQTNCSQSSIKQAIKDKVTLAEMRAAGCSVGALEKAGFTPDELQKAGYSACDLMGATGVNPKAMKNAGYTAGELRGVGYNACQLKNAGFTLPQLINAGFTPAELRGVGFSPNEISQAQSELPASAAAGTAFEGGPAVPGLPPGVSASALKAAGCGEAAVEKARAEGVSAAAMKAIGCSAKELKDGGYTAKELKDAGFTAGELKDAGFSPQQLKDAGFSARDLRKAGFTPDELKAAGFTDAELKNAGYTDKTGTADKCSKAAIEKDVKDGVSASTIKAEGCTASQMAAGGYTAAQLKAAGFTAGQLKAAGFTAAQLKNAGFSAKQLRDAGFSAAQLKNAGFTAKQLKDAGFSAGQLANAGFSPSELKNAGFTAAQMKAAGFTPKQLKDLGYTASQLKNAGFSAGQLKNAGFSAKDLKDAGFSPQALKDAGYSAKQLKDAGFSANQLRNAGFTGEDLKDAGYTPSQLTDAGISIPTSEVSQTPSAAQQDETTTTTQPAGQTSALQSAQAQQQEIAQQQELRQQQQQMTAVMGSQVSQLLTAWTNAPSQDLVESADSNKQGQGSAAGGAQGGADGASGANAAANVKPMIKAGAIMFAVLTTSIDSDYPGPILARIVSGKFKGAKLIGTLTTFPGQNKKVMLNFNTMNDTRFSKTFSISAVAISPKTARTALSSYTNNHYLLRFGSLFASSFLEGYGQAFLQAGQTVVSTPASTTITSPDLNSTDKIYVALGNVGNKFGSALEPIFNKPPTVYVYSGTGLGILFLKDVAPPAQS